MEIDREPVFAQRVINKYLGRDEKPVITILQIFREHNDRCHKLAGNGMAPGTVERYETSCQHTASFIKFMYNKEDLPITEVDRKFIIDYEFWLRSQRKCNHNTTVKYLKNFNKIIRIVLVNEYITKDPFTNIKF